MRVASRAIIARIDVISCIIAFKAFKICSSADGLTVLLLRRFCGWGSSPDPAGGTGDASSNSHTRGNGLGSAEQDNTSGGIPSETSRNTELLSCSLQICSEVQELNLE